MKKTEKKPLDESDMRSEWKAINGNGHNFVFPDFLTEGKTPAEKQNSRVKFAAGGAVMVNCITKRMLDAEKNGEIPEGTLLHIVDDLSELMIQTANMGLEGIC